MMLAPVRLALPHIRRCRPGPRGFQGSRCSAAALPAAQDAIAILGPYKKTHACVCFSTLRDVRNAVASARTAYGG
jgi:hypothetical protein